MKISTINESTDITGKLDPLIAKYEKLKEKASKDDILIYDMTIERLQNCKDLDNFINYLKAMYKNLKEEIERLRKVKIRVDNNPDNLFDAETLKDHRHIAEVTKSLYHDMISYGKSIKLF